MFAGHIDAALAIGRAQRRVNLGAFVFAALILDFVLWLLVLAGWESVTIPSKFAITHQPEFVFPYSHGLLAAIARSLLAGLATCLWFGRLWVARLCAAAFVGLAVFSHWLLDALVHAPGPPRPQRYRHDVKLKAHHDRAIGEIGYTFQLIDSTAAGTA